MPKKSDTPRTDEVYEQFGPVLHPAVMAYNSLASELERENAELRAYIEELETRIKNALREIESEIARQTA